MEAITKKDIKILKQLIGDREQEICIKEYSKCNDLNIREVQKKDKKLKTLYKLLEYHSSIKLEDLTEEKKMDWFSNRQSLCTHYLYSKPVDEWDEYDESNFKSMFNKYK